MTRSASTSACTARGAPASCPAASASGWRSRGRSPPSPALIIADEAVSSLDVLVQAQVLNLLEGLRTSLGLSYLFIAHDLALVKQVSDRVAVMYLGRLCETGPADEVYARPRHPYTVELLDAVPRVEQAAPASGGRRPAGADATAGGTAASRRRRSARRPAAGSAPGARGPRPGARRRPRSSRPRLGPGQGTWSRAISRCRRPAPSPSAPSPDSPRNIKE